MNKNDLARILFGDREYTSADEHDPEHPLMAIRIDAALKRTGKELKFLIQGPADNQAPDQSLIRLLRRARSIQDAIETSVSASIEEIASSQNITPSYVARLMRLNYLAPDIVEAIIAGQQPAGLSANKLIKDSRFPLGWHEQRIALGFAQTQRRAS
jgi:site-specific DNA recombinase